jgi:hypothetical protein
MEEYKEEIKLAKDFVKNHNTDFQFLVMTIKARTNFTNTPDRAKFISDFMRKNYPKVDERIVTGLIYYCES